MAAQENIINLKIYQAPLEKYQFSVWKEQKPLSWVDDIIHQRLWLTQMNVEPSSFSAFKKTQGGPKFCKFLIHY